MTIRNTLLIKNKSDGFTFVELAIVLMVIALLLSSVTAAYLSSFDSVSRRQGIEHAKTVQASIRAFAVRNGKLPCPALNMDGMESLVAGACPAGRQIGYVPYRTLGLELPSPSHFASYAVFRKPNSTASLDQDIAVQKERTGDTPGSENFSNVSDLVFALMQIDTNTISTSQPYTTGDDDSLGAKNCAANLVNQAAYWITVPLADANNDGNRFDGGNTPTSLCATSSLSAQSAVFDDIVILDTPLELAGWLRAWMRP